MRVYRIGFRVPVADHRKNHGHGFCIHPYAILSVRKRRVLNEMCFAFSHTARCDMEVIINLFLLTPPYQKIFNASQIIFAFFFFLLPTCTYCNPSAHNNLKDFRDLRVHE